MAKNTTKKRGPKVCYFVCENCGRRQTAPLSDVKQVGHPVCPGNEVGLMHGGCRNEEMSEVTKAEYAAAAICDPDERMASDLKLELQEHDEGDEVAGEWEFIIEQMDEGEPITFEAVRGGIQRNYAGRGPAFEVPTDETITRGVKALIAEEIVKVVS